MEPVSTDPHAFFSGKEISFYPYKAGFDYPRTLKSIERRIMGEGFEKTAYFKTIDFVKERQKVRTSNLNQFFVLSGIAGSGKSVVANRIAYDWYQNKDPVIFVDSKDPSADVQILEALIDEMTAKYRQLSGSPEPRNPKFLLIADDHPEMFNEMIDLFRRCTADGKPIDVLFVARESEFPIRTRNNPLVSKIFVIEDTISTTEIGQFADHLVKVKFARNREQIIPYIDDPHVDSFFEMMWRATNESKSRIETALRSEYEKLSPRAKKIYGYVSLIQAFNL